MGEPRFGVWVIEGGNLPVDHRVVVDRVAAAALSLRPFDLSRAPHEIETLRAILSSSREGDADANRECEDVLASIEKRGFDPEFTPLALDRDERPCGYALTCTELDPHTQRQRLVVASMAILPHVRGNGLAHHMVDRLRWSANRRGIAEILLMPGPAHDALARIAARQGARPERTDLGGMRRV